MTAVSTDWHAVIWREGDGHRWKVQPYLWPHAAACALAERLVKAGGGEAFLAPVTMPTRIVTVRVVSRD
jgi:hypothetical protein